MTRRAVRAAPDIISLVLSMLSSYHVLVFVHWFMLLYLSYQYYNMGDVLFLPVGGSVDTAGRLHCTPLHIAALQSSPEAAEAGRSRETADTDTARTCWYGRVSNRRPARVAGSTRSGNRLLRGEIR